MTTQLRAISYGGGVQSTALVVLAGQGKIDFPLALFSNVGEKAEHPETLTYVRNVAIPWGQAHGVEVVELHNEDKGGNILDLYDVVAEQGNGNIMIPARGSRTGAPGTRSCTDRFKIQVVRRWLQARGATGESPAKVAIGISIDEIQRMSTKVYHKDQEKVYPLVDLRLDRMDCVNIIRSAGLPVPRKSACYFCPYHRPQVWAEQKRDAPELFARAEALEVAIIKKREALGRDPMYLTRFGKPLSEAIHVAQDELFPEGHDSCDEGYCWT